MRTPGRSRLYPERRREGREVRDEGIGFTRRTVVLEPGVSRPSGDAEWRDAIVLVETGDVELECAAGGRRRCAAGAVLWLVGIDLRALHNVGAGRVVLVAVSRRRNPPAHGPP